MRDIKRLEKKHGHLKRRRMEGLSTTERIWHYYFDLEFDIILTDAEEQTRLILQKTYETILRYYPGYSFHKIANFISKHISETMDIHRTQRQCLNYVQDAIQVFGDPVDVSKEMKKQIYINRLHYLSHKAEKEADYSAAIKALEKAAELEKFNVENDEMIKQLISDKEAKEVVFASTKEQLESLIQQRRAKYIEENAEDIEALEDDE
jgi:PHD/YefM family antitoxin component YafN of YafNO toxin-antitoxin module